MALELIAVDHRYGRRQSLQSVHMTVQPGDCYGFIGHNGAGKTTAMRIALGLDRPQRGAVRIDGFDTRRHPREARARIGGTIEEMQWYGWATARDNLVALAQLQGLTRAAARREAERVLDEVGLAEHAARPVRTFSQGMRQRLGLAQAILGRPRYVLLDEPHNGLDPEGIAELRDLLRRLTATGEHAVLVSSHQLREVASVCNRVGVLRQGRLLLEGDVDSLLAATRGRWRLETDDRAGTQRVLGDLGIVHQDGPANGNPNHGTAFDLELGAGSPRELVRALVRAEIGVDQITPRPADLEEVYLRLSGDAPGTASPTSTTAPAARAPTPRLAPRAPALRVWLHDVQRHGRRWPVALLVAGPAVFAWRRIETLADTAQAHVAEVERGDLFSTATVTGFEAVGRGLAAGLPAITLLAAALGSQTIAGDVSLGTLRNTLLRPVRRGHVLAGKTLALATAVLTSLGLLMATAWLTAARHFAFGDRMELYRDAEPDLWIGAEEVWPYTAGTMASTLLPVLAYAALGLLVGTLVRRAVWALATALGAVAAVDLARAVARPLDAEPWLLAAHQPSPLGDTSYLAFYVDLAIGNAEAFYEFGNMVWAVPATWCAAALSIAALRLARMRVL
ncbi:MAG: ATP-binding cassette domain-containing protein [Planctomycetota bacterium]